MCELVWGELGKFVKRRSGFGENAPRRTKNFDARIKPYRHATKRHTRLSARVSRNTRRGSWNEEPAARRRGEQPNVPTQKVKEGRGLQCGRESRFTQSDDTEESKVEGRSRQVSGDRTQLHTRTGHSTQGRARRGAKARGEARERRRGGPLGRAPGRGPGARIKSYGHLTS